MYIYPMLGFLNRPLSEWSNSDYVQCPRARSTSCARHWRSAPVNQLSRTIHFQNWYVNLVGRQENIFRSLHLWSLYMIMVHYLPDSSCSPRSSAVSCDFLRRSLSAWFLPLLILMVLLSVGWTNLATKTHWGIYTVPYKSLCYSLAVYHHN